MENLLQRNRYRHFIVLAWHRKTTPRAPVAVTGRCEGRQDLRQIDIIKRGCTGAEMLLPIRRWRETFSGWPSSQAIVFLSLFGILQRRISFRDFLEFFLALGIFGNVRVILMGKFAIGFLDVIGRRETLDAQGLVVILEFHWKPVRSRMSTRPGTVLFKNHAQSIGMRLLRINFIFCFGTLLRMSQ